MTTYTIRTPNPDFQGARAGLVFVSGAATTDDAAIAEYCKHTLGYTVTPDPDPDDAKPDAPKPNKRK